MELSRNTVIIFKNCARFTNFITEINYGWNGNVNDLHTIMPSKMFLEYSDNYTKTSGNLY